MKKNAMMQKKKDVERINKMWLLYRKIIKKIIIKCNGEN